ncbi:ParA family protein [Nostoc sp.]|uniref:ParA family protein n=1 Tax=Nostoc sp. TaxID=1180 RepID=UPI002FF47CFC
MLHRFVLYCRPTYIPESSKLATVIAVACFSGGSKKTTTVVNLAIILSQRGKTLGVDFDSQGNLSQ